MNSPRAGILGVITAIVSIGPSAGAAGVVDGFMGEQVSDRNRLAGTGSPYLEQHAENPVFWQPWGEEAFRLAREKDKPVLVSIGYSTCHWCHVMAHESFESEAVAEVMNHALVSVKVDREQHPGVDAIHMEAAGVLNGSGGWPLNVFVDHEGRPFLAVTYLPRERWIGLISEVDRIWTEDREQIHQVAASLTERLTERRVPPENDPSTLPGALMESLSGLFDPTDPGFVQGDTPMKFPPSQSIDWLLEHGGDAGRGMALEILTAMMDSGLHDRVGGGFHRYSTDPSWRVPHFEKMTYDNAQLMGLYARASELTPSAELAADLLATARGTADWFLREMRVYSSTGAFLGYATATDADDPLGEGSYFAWPPEELTGVLGAEDGQWLANRWDLSGEGKLPQAGTESDYEPVTSWIPHPRGSSVYPDSYRSERDALRERMLVEELRASRSRRRAPGRDDKVLTDQNALLLEGLIRLARYGGGDIYREAARELADRLVELNTAGRKPRAQVRRTEGIRPYITDYAYLAMALAGAFNLLGDPEYVDAAEAVTEKAVRKLAVGDGTYFTTEGESELFKRAVEEFDGPSPAGQHALGIAFARLYSITGHRVWKRRAEELLAARGAVARYAPSATGTLVRLASVQNELYTLVIAGPKDHPRTRHLTEIVRRRTGPDMMVVPADESAAGGGCWAELEGRIGLKDPQLLVCREGSCLLPAFTDEEVTARLEQIGQGGRSLGPSQ